MAESHQILLIIGGGIAAYKSLDLIRLLKKGGHDVETVLTPAAEEFVTPLSVAALSGKEPHRGLFETQHEAQMRHIALSRESDLILVAPATANVIGKLSHGLADSLASALLLAASTPIFMAPAMNVKMWESAPIRRNIAQLGKDGVRFVGPEEGEMACGEYGFGRMAEPETIAAAIDAYFHGKTRRLLEGRKIVITSGPTVEPLDPVRFLSNRSSGKQGHAIAAAARDAGAEVTLVSGLVAIPAPDRIRHISVGTASEMFDVVMEALPADVFIGCAAVTDWQSAERKKEKIKRQGAALALNLVENTDIVAAVARHRLRPRLVIGFAAETQSLQEEAERKRAQKGCDWLLANDVSGGKVFGADDNALCFFTEGGSETWPLAPKREQAQRLIDKIASALGVAA